MMVNLVCECAALSGQRDFKWIEINAIVKKKIRSTVTPTLAHCHLLDMALIMAFFWASEVFFNACACKKRLNGLATAPWIGVETSCSLWRLLGKAERTVPIKMLLGKLRWTEIAHVLFSVATSCFIGALREKNIVRRASLILSPPRVPQKVMIYSPLKLLHVPFVNIFPNKAS